MLDGVTERRIELNDRLVAITFIYASLTRGTLPNTFFPRPFGFRREASL